MTTLFDESALVVAPQLLGAILRHESPDGVVAVRLTEVEAYLGIGEDPGSHAFRREGKRNRTMFGPPARLYTYFTYGMHVCANIVCSPEGVASAVLLRAGEVIEGQELARARRTTARHNRDLARGPARLTRALAISLADDGSELDVPPFGFEFPPRSADYMTGPRTGVAGAGGGATYPWRFWIPEDLSVSQYRRHPNAFM